MVENYNKYRAFIIPVTILVVIMAVMVMIGWINHIDILTTVLPGYAAMKFNTALCFILLSCSLMCAVIHPRAGIFCQLLGFSAFVLGTLSFIQHLVHLDFNVNTLIFKHDNAEPNHFYVFVMSPQTAFCISCLGIASLWINSSNKKFRLASQCFLHIVTLLATIVLVGYLYRVPNLHQFMFISSMAIPTAFAFVLLSVAASLKNPHLGITGIFTGNMIGNLMARRLFFPMLVGILFVGYLRMLSHRYQILPVELGIALFVVSFIIITLLLVGIVSSVLNRAYRKLHNAKENFRSVVESAPNALIISDIKGNIALVNNKAQEIFGYEADEMVGRKLEILVPERFRGAHSNKQPNYFRNPHSRHFGSDLDLFALHKKGHEFPVEISLTPIITKEGTVAIASIVDITQRKNDEKVIRDQLAELQFKNEELEQFNYISSHDLQEPLRTLLNYIQMLREDYPQINAEVQGHLGVMENSVTRMSQVVRSLLEYGKLGQNKKLSLTNIDEVLNEVQADLHNLIKGNNATVTVSCGLPPVYAYQRELRQLFQNLIANAIKFKKPGMAPEVNVSCKKTEGSFQFTVTDNGIGILPENCDKIFHIFQRLNKDEEYEGHGIGLANCKKIAEMHGGRIWVESEPDKGSSFYFTILNFKP